MARVLAVGCLALLACARPSAPADAPRHDSPSHVFTRSDNSITPESIGLRGHLRVSTAVWSNEESLRFADLDLHAPIFVRVESNQVMPVVDCSGKGQYRFLAERPTSVRLTLDAAEARANDPVHADAISDPLTFVFVAAGTHRLDGADLAALRRTHGCRATHVVWAIRVGRLPVDSTRSDLCAETWAPDPDCDGPLTFELISLDPFAPIVDFCPPPTKWDGWSCRLPASPPPDRLDVCAFDRPDHPACRVEWSNRSGWEGVRPDQLPAKLGAEEIELGFAPIDQRLRDCTRKTSATHLYLSVEGQTGTVTRVEARGDEATARCLADVVFTARFPTFAGSAQGIERTFGHARPRSI